MTVGVTDITVGVADPVVDATGFDTVEVEIGVAGDGVWGVPPTDGRFDGATSGSAPLPSRGTWNVVCRPLFCGCRPPTPRRRSSMFWNGSPGKACRTARPGPRVGLSSKSN